MSEPSEFVLHVFLVFCRVGGIMMLVPGFASPRIPMRIRLMFAVILAWMISPIAAPVTQVASPDMLLLRISSEFVTGVTIGLVARIYLVALEFAGTAISAYIGFGMQPGGVAIDDQATVPLTALITSTATLLFFVLNLHWAVIGALVRSFDAYPIGSGFDIGFRTEFLVGTLSQAFYLAIQISGPFLIFGLLVNLIFGVVNRLVPQVPAYFVSIPVLIAGGLLLAHFAIAELLLLFTDRVRQTLEGL
ncbi:MAG: flagellar biosynthetic protein FliR [Pseudomonadota bacterium]